VSLLQGIRFREGFYFFFRLRRLITLALGLDYESHHNNFTLISIAHVDDESGILSRSVRLGDNG